LVLSAMTTVPGSAVRRNAAGSTDRLTDQAFGTALCGKVDDDDKSGRDADPHLDSLPGNYATANAVEERESSPDRLFRVVLSSLRVAETAEYRPPGDRGGIAAEGRNDLAATTVEAADGGG
jgi:hypothetical protein